MKRKHGQLSVETMIIYGLVILVTLSVVGGLIYFKVLDLTAYLPDQCNLGGTGDLKCEEMKFGGGSLDLGIKNLGQKPIQILTVSVTDDEGVHFSGTFEADGEINSAVISASNTLASGDLALVVIPTLTQNSGNILKGTLVTTYQYKDGVVMQESVGNIRIKAS